MIVTLVYINSLQNIRPSKYVGGDIRLP